MAKYNFNLREVNSTSETPINLIVRWSGNRLVFPTSERINPKFWNKTKQRAKETKTFPEYPEFNLRLDQIESQAKQSFRTYQNDNEGNQPSINELRETYKREILKDNKDTIKTLFDFIERFIQESKSRTHKTTGKTLSKGIIYSYGQTVTCLKEFERDSKRKIDFNSIDLDFYFRFIDFLNTEKDYSVNNIGKHIRNLKTFLNDATEKGINKNLAFRSKKFIVPKEEVNDIYLNEKELEEIFNLDLSMNKRLENARDLFLVGCWTGLRFSDYSKINAENIENDFLTVKTQKTSELVKIPLHPTVKSIIEKYEGINPNSLPHSISNTKLNKYIKEVCEKVVSLNEVIVKNRTKGGQIKTEYLKKYEMITTHTARRSFATNLYISGFPSISIMKITGHKTERAFLRYIKISQEENAKLLQMHWNNREPLMKVS